MPSLLETIRTHLAAGRPLWLFLDYDGTLVQIRRTPDEAVPDPALLQLLHRLVVRPTIRTVMLSGRPLASLQAMLPIPGLILAGLYGVEIQIPGRAIIRRADPHVIREQIERVQSAWRWLIRERSGFFLEDKGMAVALHARLADPAEAADIMPQAQAFVTRIAGDQFRVLGGDRFLEIAPASAHKGKTVEWFLHRLPVSDALAVYFGDDDKDEEAFLVIRRDNGIPILIGRRQPDTAALVRLPSPVEARVWLEAIAEAAPTL